MMSPELSELLKTLLFTIVAPGTLTVWVPWFLLASGFALFPLNGRVFHGFGGWATGVGAFCYGWCALDFVFTGKGTPAVIDPPKVFVRKGLYRIVRNPMYIGMTLVVTGEALFFASSVLFVYATLLWLGFHLFVLFYEEPHLKRKFGAPYEEYLREIPRWFPRFR